MIGIILLSTYGFLLDVFEGKYHVSFMGYFDGTRDDVDGTCVGLTIRDIISASIISTNNLRDYSPV